MKKLFCCVLCLILVGSGCIAYSPLYTYADDTDYFEDIDEDLLNCEQVDEIYTGVDSIDDPQFTNDDDSEDAGISLLSITSPDDSTDTTLTLKGLDKTACANQGDTDNFKSIINRKYLVSYLYKLYGKTLNPVLEGGCSDGEYLYYSFLIKDGYGEAGTEFAVGVICCYFDENEKIAIKCMRFSDEFSNSDSSDKLINLNHANDIAYNSLKDQLVFECGKVNSSKLYQKVCVANAAYFRGETNTLSLSTKNVSCQFSCITYNESLNKYMVNVSGQFHYFCKTDNKFNITALAKKYSNFSDDKTTASSAVYQQGICCDNNYIYAIYSIDKTDNDIQNVLIIYDYSGNIVKEVNLKIERITLSTGSKISYEIENITMLGDKVLLGFNCIYNYNDGRSCSRHYCYDLSDEFFNVQYCKDSDIEKNLNSADKITSNVLYNQSTKLLKNTFKKTGYVFSGWNLYTVETNKWYYEDSETGTRAWYVEGKQPDGYKKCVYTNKQSVSKTAAKGRHVLMCAVWKASSKYYVSFNANGGSGSMSSVTVSYGTATKLPANSFTKSSRTFQGWNAYRVEDETWLYVSADGNTSKWYREGEQPTGYKKKLYSNKASISETDKAGAHVVFYALWNEFIIYYDANGKRVKPTAIKAPVTAIFNSNNTITKYKSTDIEENNTFSGYYLYRMEVDKWRYVNKTDSTDAKWYKKSSVDTDKYKLYVYTGTNLQKTGLIGEHVVIKAKWS